MPWEPLIDSEICAIHCALVPTPDGDGEIVYFGGDEHSPPELLAGLIDKSRRFNCRTGAVTYVASPPADLFCCGHGFMADGRLLVGGGTATYEAEAPDEHGELGHFTAERRCWAYNPFSPGFTEIARFGPEPGHEEQDTGGGRWYPSIVSLANGQFLAVSGHPAGDDTRHDNNTPERYLTATNSWTRLPALAAAGGYPRLHVMPEDGRVFFISGGGQSFLYHPWTGDRENVTAAPGGVYDEIQSSSVLLPLRPADGYRARVLLTGGVQPRKIDLGAAAPVWQNAGSRTGSAAGKARRNAGAVLLPTGKVLVTGGVEVDPDSGAVLEPELYDPATDAWQTLEEPAAQVRNYHSTALLMPDGRVWTAGSNVDGDRTEGGVERRVLNIEIYNPPYPAGTRPTIETWPGAVAYGQSFTLGTTSDAPIQTVALLRCGSMTHAFDADQRYVELTINTTVGGQIEVVAPPHGAVAPPGYYLLFAVDSAGRPCERGRFVRVGGEMYVITDRSHFSEVEVDSIIAASGAPATFYDSFYVVMDGFLAGDVGLPAGPALTFDWGGGGGTVPGMTHRLEETLFESGAGVPGVGQRIVLRYSVRFASDAAFGVLGPAEERSVIVTVRSGAHEAAGTLVLFKRKNPFMIDGSPHWLSVDLRVLQITADETFAGVTQGPDDSSPFAFVNGVLAELRGRPEGAMHPFDRDLSTVQSESPVEIATHVGTRRVFNYAFARVHYRAPAGQNADNVRVFFRLFTTAASSLEYRPATYPVHVAGTSATPLIGLAGGEVASIPFFAAARAANLEAQTDPQNVRTLTGTGSEEVEYFGCWLDFNQDVPRYHERPNANGVGGSGPLWTLQEHIRGQHQCLAAEVYFPEDPIPPGATPGDNDNLAQRNLMVVDSDNPGNAASHTVQHTFELRPSPGGFIPNYAGPPQPAAGVSHGFAKQSGVPDELWIRWHDLPRDSIALVYLPDVDLDELLETASRRPGPGMLARVDAHTLQCRIGDVSFLPLPGGRETNIPGLLSIQLPPTVRYGQEYRVTAHQVSGRDRKVIGSFQLTIPVRRSEHLLEKEVRKLSVLRHIALSIPATNRWHPVFVRYLDQIADRVRGFGGDPDKVAPSPAGTGRPAAGGRGDGAACPLRWLFPVLIAVLFVAAATAALPRAAILVLAVLVLLVGAAWYRRCRPTGCEFLSLALLGLAAAGVVLGIAALLGLGGAGLLTALAVLGILSGIVAIALVLLKCCWKPA